MDFFANYDLYPESNLTVPLTPWIVPKTASYKVSSLLALKPKWLLTSANTSQGTVVMTVKRNGELLAKYPVTVADGEVLNGSLPFEANEGDALFIEFSTLNAKLATQLSQVAAGIVNSAGTK